MCARWLLWCVARVSVCSLWCCFFVGIWCVFFFSSRRRHTRCLSDWSSDVCSSDLEPEQLCAGRAQRGRPVGGLPNTRIRRTRCIRPPQEGERRGIAGRRNQAAHRRGNEIGRASCRERVEMKEEGGVMKERK